MPNNKRQRIILTQTYAAHINSGILSRDHGDPWLEYVLKALSKPPRETNWSAQFTQGTALGRSTQTVQEASITPLEEATCIFWARGARLWLQPENQNQREHEERLTMNMLSQIIFPVTDAATVGDVEPAAAVDPMDSRLEA